MQTISPTRRFAERRTVPVGPGPNVHIGYVKEANRIWVCDTCASTMTLLDASDGEPAGQVEFGAGPTHFAFDPGCKVGYVSLQDADAVAVVDPLRARLLRTIQLPEGSRPAGTMPAFERNRLYTLNPGNQTVSAIDTQTNTLAQTIPVGRRPMWMQPWGLSYKPITKPFDRTYIVNAGSADVTVIEDASDRVLGTIPVGRDPIRNATFREWGEIWVTNAGDDTVSAIRIADDTVVATVPVGAYPFRMVPVLAICGRDEMWVLNHGSAERPQGEVTVVGGREHRVVSRLPVVDRPANWLINTEGLFFMVSATSREMCVVDVRAGEVVGTGRLSHDPQPWATSGLIYSQSGALFVLNSDSTVTVFEEEST